MFGPGYGVLTIVSPGLLNIAPFGPVVDPLDPVKYPVPGSTTTTPVICPF